MIPVVAEQMNNLAKVVFLGLAIQPGDVDVLIAPIGRDHRSGCSATLA
jgi:hypothetical protein